MKDPILQLVVEHLSEENATFYPNEDEGEVVALMHRERMFHHIHFKSAPQVDWFGVEIAAPVVVPPELRQCAAIWAARANRDIWVGRFELDLDSGQVFYMNGLQPSLVAVDKPMILGMATTGASAATAHFPALLRLVLKPAAGAEDDADLDFERMMNRLVGGLEGEADLQ